MDAGGDGTGLFQSLSPKEHEECALQRGSAIRRRLSVLPAAKMLLTGGFFVLRLPVDCVGSGQQKKRPQGLPWGRPLFEDASVELLCRAIVSFLVHPPCGEFSRPVPTVLLVSGYLRRNPAVAFRVQLRRSSVPSFRFRFSTSPWFRLPRPPPPTLVEARTSFSRAAPTGEPLGV